MNQPRFRVLIVVAVACLAICPRPAERLRAAELAATAAAEARVGEDIRYLASDELEGRGPDTPGLQKAADYIREEFQRLGLKSGVEDGSYFQKFEMAIDTRVQAEQTSLVLKGPDGQEIRLELGQDFQPLATGGAGQAAAEIVFAGYGISAPNLEYDDYKDADVEGKIVLIVRREPQQGQDSGKFEGTKVTSYSFIRTKVSEAKQRKAAAILMVNDPFSTAQEKKDELTEPSGFGTGSLRIPFAHVSQAIVDRMLKASPLKAGEDQTLDSLAAVEKRIDEQLAPVTQPLAGWTAELKCGFEAVQAEVANVIGVLEGEGPLAGETIVVGAHYDHLGYGPFGSRRPGVRAIHNGADDNATGTSAVLELARRFAQRDTRPARRMVFVGFTGEERGLIGSNYYLEHPVVPLDQTVTMLNFDMIGGLKEDGLLVGGVRSAKEFAGLVEKAAEASQVKVKPSETLGGSDHAGFYRKGIPVFFCFTGMTDLYHTPDDDFETIDVPGVVRTIDFAEQLLGQVVGLPQRPEFIRRPMSSPQRGGGAAYLGVVPDYAGGGEGLRITDVNADSPAAKGGLKAGDVIIKFGDVAVADIQGLFDALRKYKPDETVKVVVRRDGKEQTLDVTLGRPMGRN
ncbi:MAG: M20/M25/M40 family metallo-hydrolase [Pirellulaceae bacterium]|nr:M20/M25/M40 family metallo-hydrolase [Pirellulaceae bacterium]